MKKSIMFSLLTALLVISSCSNKTTGVTEQICIFYTGNIGGKAKPCGCNPPMGGLARRATVLNSMKEHFSNYIVMDSGAMLYETNFLYPPIDHIFNTRAPIIADVISRIGIDAANVSSYDISNSADSLLAIQSATSIPWLSSNLYWRTTGKPIFREDLVMPVGKIRVGIFGLMTDNFMGAKLYDETSPIMVNDINETAKKEVAKLDKDCDIVVALAYMSKSEVETLCDKVQGINFVVFSHNGTHNPTSDHKAFAPIRRGNTVILRCPDGGRVIGQVVIEMAKGSTDFEEMDPDVFFAENALDKSGKRKSKSIFVNTFIDLGPEIRSVKTIQAEIDSIEAVAQAFRDSTK